MTDPNHSMDPVLLVGNRRSSASYQAKHFLWSVEDNVVTITLNWPERKNPFTLDSYAELRDLFHQLKWAGDVKAIVLADAGDNFYSGGDVHGIIDSFVQLRAPELLIFTRITSEPVKTVRVYPQPIVAAIDDVCTGAGTISAMTFDLRLGATRSKTAFLFNRVGPVGCDMGARVILPRIIGQGRVSKLLYVGRSMNGEEGERQGFFNHLCEPAEMLSQAHTLAADLAAGSTFTDGIIKTMLRWEWTMMIEQVIKAEAQAQVIYVLAEDFLRAYHAFVAKQKLVLEGN